jgi:hypothetical protein
MLQLPRMLRRYRQAAQILPLLAQENQVTRNNPAASNGRLWAGNLAGFCFRTAMETQFLFLTRTLSFCCFLMLAET